MAAAAVAAPAADVQCATVAAVPVKPLRVLVGEDNPISQRRLTNILKKRGHVCLVSTTGDEVLALLDVAGAGKHFRIIA